MPKDGSSAWYQGAWGVNVGRPVGVGTDVAVAVGMGVAVDAAMGAAVGLAVGAGAAGPQADKSSTRTISNP